VDGGGETSGGRCRRCGLGCAGGVTRKRRLREEKSERSLQPMSRVMFNLFAECLRSSTRQRSFLLFKKSMPKPLSSAP
jgi:hypothetical protein